MHIRKSWLIAAGAAIAACAAGIIVAETGNFEESAPRQMKALRAEMSNSGQRIAADSSQLQAVLTDVESDEQGSEIQAQDASRDEWQHPRPPRPGPRPPQPRPPRPGPPPRPPRPGPRPPRPGPHPRPPHPGPHPRPRPGPHPTPHPGHRPGDWQRWPGHRGWVYRGPWLWYDYPWGWGWRWWRWEPWPGQIACDIHYRRLYNFCTDDCSGEYDQCVAACGGAGDCVEQCGQNMISCNYGCQFEYEDNLRNVCHIPVQ